eukprot:scaffold232428_cov35-Tisochrysis_lutea.AAC.1
MLRSCLRWLHLALLPFPVIKAVGTRSLAVAARGSTPVRRGRAAACAPPQEVLGRPGAPLTPPTLQD